METSRWSKAWKSGGKKDGSKVPHGTSKDVGIPDGYPWFNVDPIMVHNG